MKIIDALLPGQAGKRYIVGTFPMAGRPGRFTAYLRDYSFQWSGCVQYDVRAPSGEAAKRAAIKERRRDETGK